MGDLVWPGQLRAQLQLGGGRVEAELVHDLKVVGVDGVRQHDRHVLLDCFHRAVPQVRDEFFQLLVTLGGPGLTGGALGRVPRPLSLQDGDPGSFRPGVLGGRLLALLGDLLELRPPAG